MYETVISVFISVFFVFGLYCAAYEIGQLALRLMRARRNKKKKRDAIDTENKTDYNNME